MKLINILNTSRIHEGVASDDSFALPPPLDPLVNRTAEGLLRLRAQGEYVKHNIDVLGRHCSDVAQGMADNYPGHVSFRDNGNLDATVLVVGGMMSSSGSREAAIYVSANAPPDVIRLANLVTKYLKREAQARIRLVQLRDDIKTVYNHINTAPKRKP